MALRFVDFALGELFQTQCLGCSILSSSPLCGQCLWYNWLPEQIGASVQSALAFREPWRTVMHQIKYAKNWELLSLFNPVIDGFDFGFVPEQARVMPVPMHASTLRQRGFNQSEWLASRICRATGLQYEPDTLVKTVKTENQSKLDRRARSGNLKGCFRVRKKAAATVLLVDDVFTTGSTWDTCRTALEAAGAKEVWGWTLFRAVD